MDIATAVAEIDEQGFAIIRNLITGARLEQLQADAGKLLHAIDATCVDGGKVAGPMHKGALAISRAFDDTVVHPTILAVVRGVLSEARAGDYPRAEEMATCVAGLGAAEPGIKCNIMLKDAAQDIRILHRDIRLPLPHPHRLVLCNSPLALDPFTEETGATCMVPGSHRRNAPIGPNSPTQPVLMDPGSIVISDGALRRGHGSSYTYDCYRWCLSLTYHYRWMRNFPTPSPPAVEHAGLASELRALM